MSVALTSGICAVARAADPTLTPDADCVVTGLRMTQMPASQQQAAGQMLAIYYLGRLDGRAPDDEIDALIENEAENMTEAQFRAAASRCGAGLQVKAQELQKIGAVLSQAARGAAPPK